GGLYDSTKRRARGDVAVNSSLLNSLSVGNANIYGSVATGPKGSVAVGANGVVGDLAWHAGGNIGIEPGMDRNDMNVDFQDVQPPFNGGAFTPNGTGGNITNTITTVATNTTSVTSSAYPAAGTYVG